MDGQIYLNLFVNPLTLEEFKNGNTVLLYMYSSDVKSPLDTVEITVSLGSTSYLGNGEYSIQRYDFEKGL